MNALTSSVVTGCAQAQCGCAQPQPGVARINGVALHEPGQRPAPDELRDRAYGELLRQQAVRVGLLAPVESRLAPLPDAVTMAVLTTMVEQAIPPLQPTDTECQRYYDSHRREFFDGQAVHLRHILFAVTPGVNVHALTRHAEAALLDLLRKDAPADRFATLAAELSNCPTGAQGGDLGWVAPQDCAPELANELFELKDTQWPAGPHPRLVHTRFGFHIVEVLQRRTGKLAPLAEVKERIAGELTQQSRARATHQYMQWLASQANLESLDMAGTGTPLVQ